MITPIAEIIDRLSIVTLKKNHDSENLEILKEWDIYNSEFITYCIRNKELEVTLVNAQEQLFEINGKIWTLESDIRKGKENELGLEEVGRRAIAIRELNKQRINVKNAITVLTNQGHKEIKIDHASE